MKPKKLTDMCKICDRMAVKTPEMQEKPKDAFEEYNKKKKKKKVTMKNIFAKTK